MAVANITRTFLAESRQRTQKMDAALRRLVEPAVIADPITTKDAWDAYWAAHGEWRDHWDAHAPSELKAAGRSLGAAFEASARRQREEVAELEAA